MVLLFMMCLADAGFRGRKRTFELLGAALAGLTLEVLAIVFLGIYDYSGGFVLVVMDVPVCIGLGWGIAVYMAMNISDNLGLGSGMRPVVDGLLALNIDLAMDVVAIRIGFWKWAFGGFFGVPYINYAVWFFFVSCCSVTIRWIRSGGLESIRDWSVPSKVLLVPLGVLDNLVKRTWGIVCCLFLMWRTSAGPSQGAREIAPMRFEPIMFAALTAIHVFFLAVLIHYHWFGIVWLLVISVAMFLLGIVLHIVPLFYLVRTNARISIYDRMAALITQLIKV
jgi:hypothetical protein